jgi:MFS family permease
MVSPHASLLTITALQLAIFAIAAVPGYLLAVATMDRIGHRRLQWIGFAMMAGCFALAGLVPGASTALLPFLVLFGVSYFFAEFGPNTTLFVLPAELYPVSVRATAHGISSGVAKLGAFVGVFAFGFVQASLGLRGTLILCAVIAAGGALLTLVLEEPARRSLEEVAADDDVVDFTEETAGAAAGAHEEAATSLEAGADLETAAAGPAYPEGELSEPSSPRR